MSSSPGRLIDGRPRMCSTGPDASTATIARNASSAHVLRRFRSVIDEPHEHDDGRDPDVARVLLGGGGEPARDAGERLAADARVLARNHPARRGRSRSCRPDATRWSARDAARRSGTGAARARRSRSSPPRTAPHGAPARRRGPRSTARTRTRSRRRASPSRTARSTPRTANSRSSASSDTNVTGPREPSILRTTRYTASGAGEDHHEVEVIDHVPGDEAREPEEEPAEHATARTAASRDDTRGTSPRRRAPARAASRRSA